MAGSYSDLTKSCHSIELRVSHNISPHGIGKMPLNIGKRRLPAFLLKTSEATGSLPGNVQWRVKRYRRFVIALYLVLGVHPLDYLLRGLRRLRFGPGRDGFEKINCRSL